MLTSFIDVAARAKHNNVIAGLYLVVAFFFATSRFDVSARWNCTSSDGSCFGNQCRADCTTCRRRKGSAGG